MTVYEIAPLCFVHKFYYVPESMTNKMTNKGKAVPYASLLHSLGMIIGAYLISVLK